MIKFAVPLPGCPCSLKDRISDSGSDGPGSIPSGGTRKARLRCLAFSVGREWRGKNGPICPANGQLLQDKPSPALVGTFFLDEAFCLQFGKVFSPYFSK